MWTVGRRTVEWAVFVERLKQCKRCKCGPLYLTHTTIKGEMKLGLGGFLYVQCQQCLMLNRIPCGKVHREEGKRGMPSFCVNTKLGSGYGEESGKNLIENFANENMKAESKRAYEKEMSEIFQSEQQAFEEEICDLGVAVIEDEFIGKPLGSTPQSEALPEIHHCRKRRPETISVAETAKKRRLNFLPRTRTGMTVCADHAWQKRGFDSLTGHTYLLSKENKVLKTVVKHRTCGVCKWWRRRRPGQKPRHHRCVWNHKGSSRLMESEAGVEAVKEMNDQGTPIAVIEGDGDNTLIARLKCNLGRCKWNLQALIPHQFGDNSLCHARFCGYKRVGNNDKYTHRSLPYHGPLSDPLLRQKLTEAFEPVIAKSAMYVDLGSSQACEHANRATMLKAPKHLHYGESESLDFRVKATAASINVGRKYLSEVDYQF
ncbi:hypothetical protein FSP39_002859 [Pinctada imbricata]|uniref:Mutator-like transposase domain-containing protein n=1 Tax=Pinctada imbricata TaxID=66713 RepID=A0AA88XHF0_PINIB|nr:hypothetical protein FSP39_002859 [Pinctada imbricata]